MLNTELVDYYAESCYDIAMVIEQLEERIINDEDSTGVLIIPVVALFSGDYLYLDFRENVKKPTVCIYYHEESECFSPVVSKVSNSFIDFIEKLY